MLYLLPEGIDGEDAMAALPSPESLRNLIRILPVHLDTCTASCTADCMTVHRLSDGANDCTQLHITVHQLHFGNGADNLYVTGDMPYLLPEGIDGEETIRTPLARVPPQQDLHSTCTPVELTSCTTSCTPDCITVHHYTAMQSVVQHVCTQSCAYTSATQ